MNAVARVGWRRRLAAVLAVLCCGLVLGGCGFIDGMLETEDALADAGFRDATVSFNSSNGIESVYVDWTASAETSEGLRAESLRVAEVVWRVAPLKMDLVETDPTVRFAIDAVQVGTVFPRAQLESEFGPRPPGLDKEFSELMNLRAIGLGVVLAVLLFLGIIVLVIVLVVRSSRKNRAAQPAGWPPPPVQTGWQPYGQPYGAPPQPWQQQPGWPPGGGPAYPPPQQQPLYPPPPPAPGNDPWNPPAG